VSDVSVGTQGCELGGGVHGSREESLAETAERYDADELVRGGQALRDALPVVAPAGLGHGCVEGEKLEELLRVGLEPCSGDSLVG
jgi:hypothetical protein